MSSKILRIITPIFFTVLSLTSHASDNPLLTRADSLFQQKKYTESFEIYDSLFSTQKSFSPTMLKKMAFIKEGLNDFSSAIFYLHILYDYTADERVLVKIESLSQDHHLQGYERQQEDFLYILLTRYFVPICSGALAISMLVFLAYIYTLLRYKETPWSLLVVFIVIASSLVGLISLKVAGKHALVIDKNSIILHSPSAGAEVVVLTQPGDRLVITDQTDSWYHVETSDTSGFIHENNLRRIALPE